MRWWRNPNADAYGDSYGNNHPTSTYAYSYGNGDNHTTSISYAHGDRDGDNNAETYADAKAAAHAVSSSDAVSEWAKRLKELPASGGAIGNSRGDSRVPCFLG
jgi:hypothetical protein